jgi:hypothetical protein
MHLALLRVIWTLAARPSGIIATAQTNTIEMASRALTPVRNMAAKGAKGDLSMGMISSMRAAGPGLFSTRCIDVSALIRLTRVTMERMRHRSTNWLVSWASQSSCTISKIKTTDLVAVAG